MRTELEDLKLEIEDKYPTISFKSIREDEYLCLEFSTQFQNDYKFYIWVPADFLSASIGANLIKISDRHYFWYYPYDNYNDDLDRQAEVRYFLYDILYIVTKHKTRIIQKNGILFQSFNCEYLICNQWTQLYKHSAFKYGNFKFPKISERMQIYK